VWINKDEKGEEGMTLIWNDRDFPNDVDVGGADKAPSTGRLSLPASSTRLTEL
jgi:hypothetical protein